MFGQYIENIGRTAGGLGMSGGTGAVLATASTVLFTIQGNMYTLAAADIVALTSAITIADLYTNAITVYMSTAGVASYGLGVPQLTSSIAAGSLYDTQYVAKKNDTKAIIGYVIVTNATGAVFTGGATAFDAVGVTATFVDMANANLAV